MSKENKFLIPALAVWIILLAISLNFQPSQRTAWLVLRQGNFKFKPDSRVQISRCGDLSYTKGIKELQEYREEIFTTDKYGFRNLGDLENPRAVVLGDSYAAGLGLNDPETLTYQMTQILGEPVYNYGGQMYGAPAEFLSDPRFQAHPPKIAIWAPVGRYTAPISLEKLSPRSGFVRQWRNCADLIKEIRDKLSRDNYLTVLFKKIVAFVLFKIGAPLSTNTEMIKVDGKNRLTLTLQAQLLCSSPGERGLVPLARNIVELDQKLKARNIHFIFAPLLEPGTVYADFYSPASKAYLQNPPFMALLFAELKKQGVDYLDLRDDFIKNRSPYLYLNDDSHWNPRGAKVAAQVLSDYIRPRLQ